MMIGSPQSTKQIYYITHVRYNCTPTFWHKDGAFYHNLIFTYDWVYAVICAAVPQ